MKKLIVLIIIVITVIISVITLFFKKNNIESSIVFIESLYDNYKNEGMGFVYKIKDNSNYIITNYHVIDENEEIYVYNLNKEKIKAEIVNYDKYRDIAILKIEDKLNLKEAKINSDSVKENDDIYYFNINSNNIEKGKILDLNTEIFLDTSYGISYYNGILMEGNITEGNSGGPVLNKNKDVIGLISIKEKGKNNSIYLSIDNVIEIVSKLENHTLKRPNLGGIFVSSYNEGILKENNIIIDNINGVVVLDITKDYPLYKAGIAKGDIITKINNKNIDGVNELQKEIYSYNAGDIITLEYYRNKEYKSVNVKLNKY